VRPEQGNHHLQVLAPLHNFLNANLDANLTDDLPHGSRSPASLLFLITSEKE
jgi:hypothetical protein